MTGCRDALDSLASLLQADNIEELMLGVPSTFESDTSNSSLERKHAPERIVRNLCLLSSARVCGQSSFITLSTKALYCIYCNKCRCHSLLYMVSGVK